MAFDPFDWNVIVLGHWNRAILTPAGIVTRLFDLSPETPVKIEVPVDGMGPYKITHDQISVVVVPGRLEVALDLPNFELLDRARQIGVRALERLPETPVTAVGINIRYRSKEPAAELIEAARCGVDQNLTEARQEIAGRLLGRALKFKDGLVNLTLQQRQPDDDACVLVLNFHKSSNQARELIAWLQVRRPEIEEQVQTITRTLPGFETGG